jgi:DNA-directed RNA polymerase specialized sigma24 family protein
LSADEVNEFAAVVDRALERNDYELLRAFEGRSTWETYLTTVITRLFFSFQTELWGQWRPSALAQRLGPTATLLEELALRDRLSFEDAVAVMRTTHRVDVPYHRLERLYRDLHLGRDPDKLAAADRTENEDDERKRAIESALRDAVALLSPDDRLLLTLRYGDREPITRIAKLLKDDPRPLQRRIDQVKDVIRTSLATQGISGEEIDVILENADADAARRGNQRRWWHAVFPRPSTK